MGSPRIAPNRLALVIDGVDYWMDASAVTLDSEAPANYPQAWDRWETYTHRLWFFEIEGVQSTAPGSLWRLCFERAGALVPFRYAVHGNATPTPAQPHLVGKVRIANPPRLGGEAAVRGSQAFSVRLEVSEDGRPPGWPVAPTLEEA